MAQDMAQAAANSGAVYLAAPQLQAWDTADFVDSVHFSTQGAQKFAQSLAPDLANQCR
jgi:lysophospholipase L1-like esterase